MYISPGAWLATVDGQFVCVCTCVQEAQRRAKAEKNKGPGGKVSEGTAVERQQSSAGIGKTEQEDHSKMVTGQRGSSHKMMTKSSSQVMLLYSGCNHRARLQFKYMQYYQYEVRAAMVVMQF